MNGVLAAMLRGYELDSLADYELALKETVQRLALLGLWRAKFFHVAAFYGGTALRIFHGLPRFSEDLDFSLLDPSGRFDLDPYLAAVDTELACFALDFQVERKRKRRPTAIATVWIKGLAAVNLLRLGAPGEMTRRLPRTQTIRVKLELDTDPPPLAGYEVRPHHLPHPFYVRLFDPPSLFAGKLHALLCRKWETRIKGRDYYDFLWYAGQGIRCHLPHLQARMEQTGHWPEDRVLGVGDLHDLLKARFRDTDFERAKADVLPFLRDKREVEGWSEGLFLNAAGRVRG